MKVAVYCRVSTDEQSTGLQTDAALAYCKAQGWESEVFEDKGVSGAMLSRPAFDRALTRVRAGEFGALMVWRFDRASRSTKQLILLLDELDGLGVAFVSLQERIDTTTPAGRLMFTLISAMAEFERQLIGDRVRAGMKAAQTRGAHVGRPRCKGVEGIVASVASGETVEGVAARLGVHVTTVRRALRQARKAGVAA